MGNFLQPSNPRTFNKFVIHRCVGFCKFEVDVAGKRKSGKPLYCLLSGLYWTVKNIKMADRVGFRFNHPNSLNFIPALALTYIKCIPKMDTFQATFSYVILLHRF